MDKLKLFKIITLGCKVNQCESAFIEESLIRKGCQKTNQDGSADLVIINGCIVTAKASFQSRQAIRRAVRKNPGAIIGAVGCYGQVFPEELSRIDGINIIAGNNKKNFFPDLLMSMTQHNPPLVVREEFDTCEPFEQIPIKKFSDRTRAFLKIQDGCESLCSYCIIPKARGPLRSLETENVIQSLKIFEANGYKEVVLTGINLGKYGHDLSDDIDLTTLLYEIDKNKLHMRIRLSSLDPTEVNGKLIELMASRDWLCRHFHISLQSGDDLILKRMNRHYTAAAFIETVHNIKDLIPGASIGVDVLVGFPGENNDSINRTFNLLEGLPVSYLHVFPYSKRKGTPAARFSNQVDNETIKKRASSLRYLDQRKRWTFRKSLLGKAFPVLAEGWVRGSSGIIRAMADNYVHFTFPSKIFIKNKIVRVMAKEVTEDGVSSYLLEPFPPKDF